MAEDVTRYAAVSDALDHRGMVSSIGEDMATFKFNICYQDVYFNLTNWNLYESDD